MMDSRRIEEKRVYYVWNEDLIEQCDRLPAVTGRASIVHGLIAAYQIQDQIKIVRSIPATYKDLLEVHAEAYLEHLKIFQVTDDNYVPNEKDEQFGIGYDCSPVSKLFELVSTIAGGSVTGARCLTLGIADVAINWCGGWHHAQQWGAEGFCYVNDVVLAITKLKLKFHKILYVDLDVHHGNGVQNAFMKSNSVFTLSFHKFEPGFYPGSGGINDIGILDGEGYACNVPLEEGYSNDTLEYIFGKVFISVYDRFAPDAIVLQCGADALAHDPNGGANVTIQGYCACVRMVLDKRKPTLLLGGGGYNHPNTARLWTSITALAGGVTLDQDIPEHAHWPQYGPDFMIHIEPTLVRDSNKKTYIDESIHIIEGNLMKYLHNKEDHQIKTSHLEHRKLTTHTLALHDIENRCSSSTDDVYEFIE